MTKAKQTFSKYAERRRDTLRGAGKGMAIGGAAIGGLSALGAALIGRKMGLKGKDLASVTAWKAGGGALRGAGYGGVLGGLIGAKKKPEIGKVASAASSDEWIPTTYKGKKVQFKNNKATAAIMKDKLFNIDQKWKKLVAEGLAKER